jgi:hypothetical protein
MGILTAWHVAAVAQCAARALGGGGEAGLRELLP